MPRRTIIATACTAMLAVACVIPIAAASGATHVQAIHTALKVLGQAKPVCHAGVCIIHNHGNGTMSGFGDVTFTTTITDDQTSPSPCPNGSWVPRLRRTIHTSKGNLILNEAGLVCTHPNIGPRVDLVWVADGTSSTGAFHHATGTGNDHAYLARNTAVQTGQITLSS
ncbi:MAG: hypothetical protein JO240_09515 [Solirubrobacterales bacterium]|nr:hypothetical protein [Solirubrobacterales bacterium]